MSFEFILRIVGMIIMTVLGVFWGNILGDLTEGPSAIFPLVLGLVGALIGLVLTPFVTTRPIRSMRSTLGKISAATFFAGLAGLISGLLIAALIAFPISLLPDPFGQIIPFLGAIVFGYLGVSVFAMRQADILGLFRSFIPGRGEGGSTKKENDRIVLLDTSVIIDGRIADIARTGFLPGMLLIPRFVLNELQYIADSADSIRRQRGRRGLEVIADLQKETAVSVRISDIDIEDATAVDDKLVVLARQLRCPVLTNDYNLNRVADIQGVKILNINELANAVKAVFLPGEPLNVEIIQEGKEFGQGVGYLEDGTMVVVEQGSDLLGERVNTVVTKVLQTAAGRMIFARPE